MRRMRRPKLAPAPLTELDDIQNQEAAVADRQPPTNPEEATVKTRVHPARRLLQKDLTGELAGALTGTYHFDGARCDRLVSGLFARINQGQN